MARISTIASRNRLSRRRTKRPARLAPPAARRVTPRRLESKHRHHAALSLPRQGVNNKAAQGPPLPRSRCNSSDARMAVLGQSEGALGGADGGTRAVADDAVESTGIEPPRGQQTLQLLALGPVERLVVRRPGRRKRRAAGDPVGEMADGERVRRGLVVFAQRPEIARDQECRPSRPCRKDELQRRLERRIATCCDRSSPLQPATRQASCCVLAPTRQSRSPAAG